MKYINNEKLNIIKLNTKNFYVAIDFDRTMTTLSSSDSWDVAGKLLGEEFNKKILDLYQKYRPIELNYNISFEEKSLAMEKWYRDCVNLYYEYKLTDKQLEDSIEMGNLIFRKGCKNFLKFLHINNIPVIVLSAGIGNIIEKFLKINNCYYDNIFMISNFIEFDENGYMKKFDGPIIHTSNKTMKDSLPKDVEEKLNKKEYRLLLGDTIEDKKMIPYSEWDKTISVGFLNEKIEEDLEVYKQNYDIVLTNENGNFEELKKILSLLY